MNSSSHKKRKDKKSFFLIIHQDDIEFLDNNHCAAAVMSVFRSRYKWKLETAIKNKRTNSITEQHDENVPINFTITELLERILHLFGRNAVIDSLKILKEKGVISVHFDPNQKYSQRRYFLFHPKIYSKWLQERDQEETFDESESTKDNQFSLPQKQCVEKIGILKTRHASFKNKREDKDSFKSKLTLFKNKPHIDINKNINNTSINIGDNFLKMESSYDIKFIIDALIEKGFPIERFQYASVMDEMVQLKKMGDTVKDFIEAYEKTKRSKGDKPFAARYLIKVVGSILVNRQKDMLSNSIYENDFTNGLDWMSDLLEVSGS